MRILKSLASIAVAASALSFVGACSGKVADPTACCALSVKLGNATQAQIVQTSVALSNATQVAQDRISNVAPNYTDPSMQQMGQLVQTCSYTPDTTGGGTLGGANCPISNIEKFVGTSSASSYSGQSTTNYSALTSQYQGLDLVQDFTEVETINSGFPTSASTFSYNGIVNTASWSYISFTGTMNMTAANTTGQYTFTSTLNGTSSVDSAVFGIAGTGHVDTSTGRPVTDSQTCTLNSVVVACSSIGQ